jgi:2-dehydro-3-deoxyglucarate aldolase
MEGSMAEQETLKARLAKRTLTLGSWISCGDPAVAEIMAKAGFEWLVVDMEHTCISSTDEQRLIQVIDLCGCVPMVRVGANDPLQIKRAMDAGAQGVVVPMVNSRDDAERAVNALYYPPLGARGVGLARAQAYGREFSRYCGRAALESVLIVQIEHIDAVECLGDILAVEGVDGFMVGPYDLSGSLGYPGDWGQTSVVEALGEVEKTMHASSKPGGFHVVHSDRDELRRRIELGYRFIAYGDDMVFLSERVSEEAEFARDLVREARK